MVEGNPPKYLKQVKVRLIDYSFYSYPRSFTTHEKFAAKYNMSVAGGRTIFTEDLRTYSKRNFVFQFIASMW